MDGDEFRPDGLAPVLLIVHKETSSTGRVGRILAARGHALDIRCPNTGDSLPPSLDGYAAAVIFGGPMSANDDRELAGIRAELDWIPRAIDSGRPLLGVCLGAQLIARALGGRVGPHDEGLVEIGYEPVRPTEEGRDFLPADPFHVYQWHKEGFTIPAGAVRLAASARFPNQAFRYGDRVFGIQFHADVVYEQVDRWTTHGAQNLVLPGAQPRAAHLAGHARYDAGVEAWMRDFLGRLLAA